MNSVTVTKILMLFLVPETGQNQDGSALRRIITNAAKGVIKH